MDDQKTNSDEPLDELERAVRDRSLPQVNGNLRAEILSAAASREGQAAPKSRIVEFAAARVFWGVAALLALGLCGVWFVYQNADSEYAKWDSAPASGSTIDLLVTPLPTLVADDPDSEWDGDASTFETAHSMLDRVQANPWSEQFLREEDSALGTLRMARSLKEKCQRELAELETL